MSFLSRISARSRAFSRSTTLVRAKTGGLMREAEPDDAELPPEGEDTAQPLRRQAGGLARADEVPTEEAAESDEDAPVAAERVPVRASVQQVHRDTAEDGPAQDEDTPAAMPMRREAEPDEALSDAADEAAAARSSQADSAAEGRDEGEDTAQPQRQASRVHRRAAINRQTAGAQDESDEDEAVSRSEAEPEDTEGEDAAQPLRRKSPPSPQALTADNSPQPEDAIDEPAPALQAKALAPRPASPAPLVEPHTSPTDGAPSPDPVGAAPNPAPQVHSVLEHGSAIAPPHGSLATFGESAAAIDPPQRPKIHIEQVDVVIHEPAPPAQSRPSAKPDRQRQFRARYLGGL